MTKTIERSVRLAASPKELFDTRLDSKKHAAATGGRARMSRKAGRKFTARNGQLQGRNLLIVASQMIVQASRATRSKHEDPDSILVLRFSRAPGGGRIDLVHANVPGYDHAGVTKGWPRFYWKP